MIALPTFRGVLAGGFDPDAAAYFAAIVAAGSSISAANKSAVDAFVKGCKADGIWSAIKACCLLAGPDDLTGALVPLVGAAPTNVSGNFLAGDYNRTTGLTGDGTSKYLDANRANDADPQDNAHMSLFVVNAGASGNFAMGAGVTSTGATILGTGGGVRNRNSTTDTSISSPTGFFGMSRSDSAGFIVRAGGTNYPKTRTSQTPALGNVAVFANIGSALISNGTYSFYSIGEALDLALLDARLTTYMAALT